MYVASGIWFPAKVSGKTPEPILGVRGGKECAALGCLFWGSVVLGIEAPYICFFICKMGCVGLLQL